MKFRISITESFEIDTEDSLFVAKRYKNEFLLSELYYLDKKDRMKYDINVYLSDHYQEMYELKGNALKGLLCKENSIWVRSLYFFRYAERMNFIRPNLFDQLKLTKTK